MATTLKTAAEYYSNPTKYSGAAGTDTNPYCIETLEDLFRSDATAYTYMLVNDLDFNNHEEYRKGFNTDTTIFECGTSTLNGQDDTGTIHHIRNIVILGGTIKLIAVAALQNIYIDNIINLGAGNNTGVISASTYSSCIFGIYLSNCAFGDIIGLSSKFNITDCTFNISGQTSGNNALVIGKSGVSGHNYTRCLFNLDIIGAPFTAMSPIINGSTNSNCKLTNCAFRGRISVSTSSTTTSNMSVVSGMTLNNCYIGCDINFDYTAQTRNSINAVGSSISINATSFIDISVIKNSRNPEVPPTVEKGTTSANWYLLTHDQATSASYLRSINFMTT